MADATTVVATDSRDANTDDNQLHVYTISVTRISARVSQSSYLSSVDRYKMTFLIGISEFFHLRS